MRRFQRALRRNAMGRILTVAGLAASAAVAKAQVAFDSTAVTNISSQLSTGATSAGQTWVTLAIGFAAITLGFGIFYWGKRRAHIGG